jgi:hypothetical protein
MQGEWTSYELVQFEAIHMQLLRGYSLSKRLDVLYIPFYDLGKHGMASPDPTCVMVSWCRRPTVG